MQRRALLAALGLPTNFYLTLARPLPSTLLAATAVCLMPDAQAYELLSTSGTSSQQAGQARTASSNPQLSLSGDKPADMASSGKGKQRLASAGPVAGTVEVKASPAYQQQGAFYLVCDLTYFTDAQSGH